MIGAPGPGPVPSGLAARIIGFLSIALVPMGVVAYFQTAQLSKETRARTELSLISLTETLASGERNSILRALGNAQALGATVATAELSTPACTDTLRGFLEATPGYSFVGILPRDGVTICNSAGRSLDFSSSPSLVGRLDNPKPLVIRNDRPMVSPSAVLVVSEPYYSAGEFAGYVTLSLPAQGLRGEKLPLPEQELDDLVTFNNLGQVLSSRAPRARALRLLPEDMDLAAFIGREGHSFSARSADGVMRVYAVAPLVPDLVYALSVWPQASVAGTAVEISNMTKVLPFAMWAASVIVAFLAINGLVIRHIKTLSQQMRAFARTRRIPQETSAGLMPRELRNMESDFLYMADAILRDEAQLENTLREKTILLKEVHHRVKNNLQLISSIMNMQIRQSGEQETRDVLRRLQDRIRGLATIHRNLYQTEDLGHVNAGKLLDDLIRQMAIVADQPLSAIKLETRLEDIEIYPDQAVPLSLLTAEALTNAGKYIRAGADGEKRLSVTFRKTAERRAEIDITNTCAVTANEQGGAGGLGERLIRAFATQLGGELTQGAENGVFRVHVEFTLTDFQPEVVDY